MDSQAGIQQGFQIKQKGENFVMDMRAGTQKHLTYLSAELGARPSGSEENHAAAEYIETIFREAGLDVERQQYTCPAWQAHETHLAANGQPLTAVANAFSPACDVTAPLVPVATVAELEAADLTGRIALLYGALTRATLSPKSWFLASERDQRIIGLLEKKAPAAVLTIQTRRESLERLIEDAEFDVPSATVGAEAGLALLQTTPASVHLRIESERRAGWSCNVVGRRGAADRPKVVLCAHYDTKIGTPGATDNATGTAVLLALAERLEHQDLALEIVAFSGHEYLPLGDDEYVRLGEAQFLKIVAALNFDAVGNALSAGSITAFRCAPRFQEDVAALTNAYPGITWVEPWPESNHSTFAWRGVPSLAFSSLLGGNITHEIIDTVDRVSLERLVEHVTLAEAVVERLHGKTPAWTRETGADQET